MHPKTEIFLLNSFGVKSLRNFIVKNGKKTINKMLLDTENMTRTDGKLTLVKIDFSMKEYRSTFKKSS